MYDALLWKQWVEKEKKNYKVVNGKRTYLQKGYTHFDDRFWFPDKHTEIEKLIKNNLFQKNPVTSRSEFWQFSPFIKLLIKTPRFRYQEDTKDFDLETKIRPICFAAHRDSLILSYYAYILTKKYENYIRKAGISPCILAYRTDLGLSNIQFAKEVFNEIQKKGSCSAIALDIKGYFDNLDHIILLEKWKKTIGQKLSEEEFRIYKILTNYSYVSGKSLLKKFRPNPKRKEQIPSNYLKLIPGLTTHEKFGVLRKNKLVVTNKNGRGIPQGSAMSSVLSNIYLVDFDTDLQKKSKQEGFLYRRYCDDILIVCETEKASELKKYIIEKINSEEYKLIIQDKKVEIIDFKPNSKNIIRSFKRNINRLDIPAETNIKNEKHYYKHLQYLGFEFNGQSILIRSASLSRFFRKMKARIEKTISMAYGRSESTNFIKLDQILERYSHLGKRNFLSYAYRAASKTYKNHKGEEKEGMDSPSIRKQIRRHMLILTNELHKKNEQRHYLKKSLGKEKQIKTIKLKR